MLDKNNFLQSQILNDWNLWTIKHRSFKFDTGINFKLYMLASFYMNFERLVWEEKSAWLLSNIRANSDRFVPTDNIQVPIIAVMKEITGV